jgi:hypothetical protein
MHFTKLDDSPMFRKQLQSMEESAEILRERSLKFYKGCRKYTEGLGEAYDGDIAFASALETFGGGHNDPISVAFGGMTDYMETRSSILSVYSHNLCSFHLRFFGTFHFRIHNFVFKH